MNERLEKLRADLEAYLSRLAPRERLILTGGALGVLCFIILMVSFSVGRSIKSREQRLWWEQFHAGRRQFDRQRQPIQAHTYFGDGPSVGVGQLKVGLRGLGALEEERHRSIV